MKTVLATLALATLATFAGIAPASADVVPRTATVASVPCYGTEWGVPVTYRCDPVTGERLSNRFVFRR